MRILFALAIALSVLSPTHSQGEQTMCTGAEPAAAGAAKGAADVGMAAAAGEGFGASAASLAAANAAGAVGGDAIGTLLAGNAASWGIGIAPEVAAASAPFLAGASAGLSAAGGGGLTASNVAAGASAANAGVGLLTAMKGQKTPAPPAMTAPIVMPTPDDQASQRARSAMLSKLSQRRGRTSTILSNDTLGGN